MRMTCHRIGRPPISTSGFGIVWVCSRSRVPRPPQRMTTLGALTGRKYGPWRPCRLGSVPGEARAQLAGGLRRLVNDRARGALDSALLAERHAQHAAARVARGDGDPAGDASHGGAGPGGHCGHLALTAATVLRGDRLAVPADRGSLRLAGCAGRLGHRIRAFLALAHPECSSSSNASGRRITPARRSKPLGRSLPSWANHMMAPLIDHDRIAEVYEGTVGSREFQQVSRRRIHWMCAQVGGPDVLDVGCSQGIASILLAREGHRVVGIDREHEAIRAARERLDQEEAQVRERAEFRVGEGRAVGFADGSFDAVLLGEVLEHQLDPGKLLDEARRVLRPGGRIVITTPYGIHPYPDHKEPLYLSALLERLSSKLSLAEIALVDRYAGVVAERSKDRAPRVWRRALRVAESRLADQDEAVEKLRGLVSELREGARALQRSLQEEDLTKRATEIQRDAARQRQADLEQRLADAEDRAKAATAQRDSALENLEQVRERLHAADLGHQKALADAARRAEDLEASVESLRRTVGVLTSEGAELRTSLSAAEAALVREQAMRRSVEGRLAAVTESRARLEEELAEIKGRPGYRIGRFLRRPIRR